MRTRAFLGGVLLIACAAAPAGMPAALTPNETVRASFRRVLDAPEARARMTIERSDPFGGAPAQERGTLWLIPGRGLRYRAAAREGQEILIDRGREVFLLYSPAEGRVYRAAYARAPSRLRRLIGDPDRLLGADLEARPERRRVKGAARDGYRLRSASLGDSLPRVSLWMAADPRTTLPRWITIASSTDTVWVEFSEWTLYKAARPADLELSAPKGTPESPLDPRELLNR